MSDIDIVSSFPKPSSNEEVSKKLIKILEDVYTDLDPAIMQSYLEYDYSKEDRNTILAALAGYPHERLLDDVMQSPDFITVLSGLLGSIIHTLQYLKEEESNDVPEEGEIDERW